MTSFEVGCEGHSFCDSILIEDILINERIDVMFPVYCYPIIRRSGVVFGMGPELNGRNREYDYHVQAELSAAKLQTAKRNRAAT